MKKPPARRVPSPKNAVRRAGPLFTDLYELTMAACYHDRSMEEEAVFSLLVRESSGSRNYFVAAGLADVVSELSNFGFDSGEIDYLQETGLFREAFLSFLKDLKFTGTLHAMPEGTLFFPEEPILEVHAPVIEAQVLETYLLNTVGFQTLIASKAARCVEAAKGRPLIDFSMRRTHGLDAGLKVARSSYLAGFSATSNVLAGKLYDIPVSGTMAHSFVMAFNSEEEAFSAYEEVFPESAVFLIDTYDTLEGARCAARVGRRMKKQGRRLLGVRLDSGDLAALSKKVRRILDDAGLTEVKVYASSGLDEEKIVDLLDREAAIDAFGVGTKMGVSADAPYMDIVYKMVHFAGRDVRKTSPGKVTLAGEKQVFRKFDASGKWAGDIIGLPGETIEAAERLLKKVMQKGKPAEPPESLRAIRERVEKSLQFLPGRYRSLQRTAPYPVAVSPALAALQKTAGP